MMPQHKVRHFMQEPASAPVRDMLEKVRATVSNMSKRMPLDKAPDPAKFTHEAERSLLDAVEAVRARPDDIECLTELGQAFGLVCMVVIVFDPNDAPGTLNRMLLFNEIHQVTKDIVLTEVQ